MNKAINPSGNFTINYPTKEFTKTPNYLITNKTLKPFETLVLQFVLSLHPNTKLTQHLCSEAFDVSLRHIERVFKVFHDKGLVTSYKKKNDNNLYDTFYDFHTDILDGTREDLPDELVGTVPDTDVGTRENIKESLESNNDKCLSTVIENSSIPTQMSGHINTNLNNKTIYNTKEKINNKKEGELMSYESTVKLMRDKLVYSGKVENLIKEFGIDEVNKHLRYLDYFELDKLHQNYKKNLTFAFLESLRNNLPAPIHYQQIENDKIHNQRLVILDPVLKLFNIKSQDRIDLYLEICRNINYHRLQDKLNKDEYTKQGIDFANRRSLRSRQYELSLEEKSKLIEDLTLKFYKDKNTRIDITKKLVKYDIKKVLNLVKITLTDNKYSTISLKNELEEYKGDVNKYLFNLEIWVLNLSNKEIVEEVLI